MTPDRAIAGSSRGSITAGPGGVVASGGRAGVATGPGGTVAGASRDTVAVGPDGAVAGSGRGGITTGHGRVAAGGSRGVVAAVPGEAIATGGRAGFAAGPGDVVAGAGRGTAAVGPYGAVAAGLRAACGLGPDGGFAGTRYISGASLREQGAVVRDGFGYYNASTPGWYARYPGAWLAAGWAAGTSWSYLPWGGYACYVGYPADTQPIDYNYGNTVVYQGGQVYYDDQPVATEAEYAQQAAQIADTGRQAEPAADASSQLLVQVQG